MSKNKSHNSILFLTTLGLYFGLVLAGASPQLLAQAATARNFDIKDEIEFKDDLDKKPDTDDEASPSIDYYLRNIEDLIEDLRELRLADKFDPRSDRFTLSRSVFTPCDYKGDPVPQLVKATSRFASKSLESAVTETTYRFEGYTYLSDCFKSAQFGQHTVQKSNLYLDYDKSSLTIKVSFEKRSPELTRQAAANFTRAFEALKFKEEDTAVKNLAQNTSFSFDNNQVFIVTRLPRGSIDKLFAPAPAAAK